MDDLTKRIIADVVISSGILGIFAFLVQKWITQAIERRYQALLEKEKAIVELQKQSAANLLDKQNAIYPEIVETIYRLRNHVRDTISTLTDSKDGHFYTEEIGELAFMLSERLYTYRVYLDEPVFQLLHRIKRASQDAYTELSKLTRRDNVAGWRQFAFSNDKEFQQRVAQALPSLQQLQKEIDTCYEQSVDAIKTHMEGILRR